MCTKSIRRPAPNQSLINAGAADLLGRVAVSDLFEVGIFWDTLNDPATSSRSSRYGILSRTARKLADVLPEPLRREFQALDGC
jgi:hypothetical protein